MIYYEWLYIYIKNEIKVFALQAPELIIAYKFYNTYFKCNLKPQIQISLQMYFGNYVSWCSYKCIYFGQKLC
mgnify:CR=1 FL=1